MSSTNDFHPLNEWLADPTAAGLQRVRAELRRSRRPESACRSGFGDVHDPLLDEALAREAWRFAAALARIESSTPSDPNVDVFAWLVACLREWSIECAGTSWTRDIEHHVWERGVCRGIDTDPPDSLLQIDQEASIELAKLGHACGAWPSLEGEGPDIARMPMDVWQATHDRWLAVNARDARVLRGDVVDASGTPVSGALTCVNEASVRTASDGSFTLVVRNTLALTPPTDESVDRLHVLAQDGSYAIVPEVFALDALRIRVVLTDTMTHIWGTVVDDRDVPVAGAFVSLERGTPFGWLRAPTSGWSSTRWEDVALEGWFHFPTDEAGRFSYPAFADRAYDIHALAGDPLRHAVARGVAGGTTDLVLRLPGRDVLLPVVTGVARTRSGAPVAGVTVSPRLMVRLLPPRSTSMTQSEVHGTSVCTDAVGRFELHDVPRSWLDVCAFGEAVEFTTHRFEPVPSAIELMLPRMAELRLRLRDGDDGPVFVRTESGSMIRSHATRGGGVGEIELSSDSLSRSVWLPETEEALVVERLDGDTLTRLAIRLDPDRPTDVQV